MSAPGAIDCWVNVNMGDDLPPEWLTRVKEDYFKAGEGFLQSFSADEMLELMDRAGIARAVITVEASKPDERALAFPAAHPDRFALAANVNIKARMKAVRTLEALVREHPVVMARVVPFMFDLPPHHRLYYPIYAKCVELDLPISVNTGIPGPPMPGECQHPMHLDRVCLDFPELKVVMAHGADPWWGVAMRLMLKYPGLHLMTSAYSPKYLPAEFVHFMNTRGRHKVLYASDHPVLSTERCLAEAKALDLRPEALDGYLQANATRLLFPSGD